MEYRILDIKGGENSRFGEIVIIKANPVMTNSFGTRSVIEHHCKETETFHISADKNLINDIVSIAQRGLWTPNIDDYIDVKVFSNDLGKNIVVHSHISFYGGKTNLYSNVNVSAINNFAQKKEALASNYIKFMRNNIMSGYDLQDYLAALSEDDDTFFSWLFDDMSLRGYKSWELSDKLKDDWIEFYNSFADKEYEEENIAIEDVDSNKMLIKTIIDALDKLRMQLMQTVIFESNQHALGIVMMLHEFASSIFYAWEYYGYGHISDFWKEDAAIVTYESFKSDALRKLKHQAQFLNPEIFPLREIDTNGSLRQGFCIIIPKLIEDIEKVDDLPF